MTRINIQSDIQKDKSDVLSLLTTIEDMFRASRNTFNEYSRTLLLLSVSIDSQMLLEKLRVMYQRWQIHLPFKEACGVDFYDWVKKMDVMRRQLDDENDDAKDMPNAYCPSKHFLLDLYAIIPKAESESGPSAPYYEETIISDFLRSQERMRKVIAGKWPEYKHLLSDHTLHRLSERLNANLDGLYSDSGNIQRVCRELLADLAVELSRLSDMSLRVIKGDEYVRLAERIVSEPEYDGRKAQREALAYFSKWKNGVPEDQVESERKYEIEMAVSFISDMKYGRFLGRYVHLKDDVERQMRGLGRFLYTYRLEIGKDELRLLLEQVYRIHYFLEDQRQSQGQAATSPESTPIKETEPIGGDKVSDIDLPNFINHDLRVNALARNKFLKVLREVGPYVGRNLTLEEKNSPAGKAYIGWKWHHIYNALSILEIITPKTPQNAFADFMSQVLPGRKSASILRSLYRNFEKKQTSIQADVIDKFRPVKQMI